MQEPFINTAVKAARTAGDIITRSLSRLDTITITEKSPNDFVTEIDKLAEAKIIEIISKAYPQHGFLAEESGTLEGNDYTWIIDPIDGTRNFIHGMPHFAVSIALKCKNKIEHGVIYDPTRQELFTATRGKGAQLNNRRLRVSKRTQLNECLLGTGFAFRHLDEPTNYMQVFQELLTKCGDIRRAGSATLDLAYVAAGRFDGFWEMGLKPWDIAAGILLIKEAGGLVSDFSGGEDYFTSGNVVAANPKIFKPLLQAINKISE